VYFVRIWVFMMHTVPSCDENKSSDCHQYVYDDETTKFKLKFVGREDITTKFELCHLWSLKPLVQSGACF
jgi:hypothetical protein